MRLIDADALRELIDGGFDIDFDETPEVKAELLNMIDYQETIDAAPIRRGKWDKNKIAFHWKCSECGAAVFDNFGVVFDYTGNEGLNFCPNCGARMEEKI